MYRIIVVSLFIVCLGDATISRAGGPKHFPELINTDIPGAPKLGKPVLIMGSTGPVKGEGMGWAAPAVYDWDGDGRRDLLIGEFGSGVEHGKYSGNFIRVYRNIGNNTTPEFTDKFYYAHYAYDQSPNGTPISVKQFCCQSFAPQFVDLDNDGRKDMITGQYEPGHITWFRNTEKGFLTGVKLDQAGDPDDVDITYSHPRTDPESPFYWQYSSASFGDFDGDGDYDLITGGSILRISENIGSKTQPKFGLRKQLLDTNGKPLRVYPFTKEELKEQSESGKYGYTGDLTVPVVVDWDQDGVLDLLVTGSYSKKGSTAVTFFRGVKTRKAHRFEPGKPLFTNKWGDKAFPGSWLQVFVTDWNSDGINDLLIGASVATVNDGEFDHSLSWSWELETGIQKKNPGLVGRELKSSGDKYLRNGGNPSLIHQGYVYVMLGEKR